MRVGALCHPLLPYCPTDLTVEKRLVTGRRYVDFSIRQLAWQFDQLDVSRGEVQVKVFGGAEVVGIGTATESAIGKLSSEAAIEVLEAGGFQIIASSLGGNLGRQMQFHTGTGEVALRWLGKTRAEEVIDE